MTELTPDTMPPDPFGQGDTQAIIDQHIADAARRVAQPAPHDETGDSRPDVFTLTKDERTSRGPNEPTPGD